MESAREDPGSLGVYDPVSPRSLAESIGRALESLPASRLVDLDPEHALAGPGVYAIYYVGECRYYEPLSRLNRASMEAGLGPIAPIYVGKAVPEGSRSRRVELDDVRGFLGDDKKKKHLVNRLLEHLVSIGEAENLLQEDFLFRGLILAPIWVRLGESLLIQYYEPVWNQKVKGFGNHDPGSGREKQKRSDWDTLHPGRAWAAKLQPGKDIEKIEEALRKHWSTWRGRVLDRLPPERRRLVEERSR